MIRVESVVSEHCRQVFAMFAIDCDRQNTGGMTNASGQYVQFGTPGNADFSGMLRDGRKLDVEVKRSDFHPRRVRGKDRLRFLRQLERLRRTNAQGGVGLWVRDGAELAAALQMIVHGARVEIDDRGFCYVVSPDGDSDR